MSVYVATARRLVSSYFRAGRPRAEVVELVDEMLPLFPVKVTERKVVERRIRAGLERIYDEFRNSESE